MNSDSAKRVTFKELCDVFKEIEMPPTTMLLPEGLCTHMYSLYVNDMRYRTAILECIRVYELNALGVTEAQQQGIDAAIRALDYLHKLAHLSVSLN